MGSKTSSQSNQQSATVADPQAYADYNQTIRRAKQVSNTPYTAYSGQLTAPTNAQEGTATTALNGLGAVANGYFGSAAYQSGLGAAAVNPAAVNGAAIGQYMSPYQSDVVNSTAALLNQQDQIQQQQLTSSAIGSGAFGGDRSGLAAAALAGQQDLANNSTLAGLENQNYSQALSEANTQQQVGLGAAQANRAAVQQNAATLAGIGSASTSAGLGVAGAQLGAGELQQQTQQAGDTAQYGQFLQEQAYPFQTEQYLANIVEGIAPNYGSTTAGTTTTQTSPLNAILGGATLAGGLAPSMSGLSTGLGSLATGIGNIFTASDRRVKENIAKAGKLFDGQPVYTFNYKGSPVTELGLVAQDVEKKHPGAVMTLGDIKHVDYEAATRAAVDRGHFARGGRTLGDVGFHTLTREEVAHLDDDGDRPKLTLGDVPAPRASGGVVGVGVTPYADVESYVPVAQQGLGAARMLTSSLPSVPQSTASTIPNFQQLQQAGQGLGSIGSGLGNVASDVAAFSAPANGYGLPFGGGHADGGKVTGLGAVRMPRRGYDGGGVVGADDLVFDPDAVGPAQTVQPGLGAVAQLAPAAMTPPSSQGLGAVQMPPPSGSAQSQGLGAAAPASPPSARTGLGAAAPSNDNAPVPVAPAPVMTPIIGYRQSDGTVTPTQSGGLGAVSPPPATGLGAATVPPTGLGAAQPPQNGVAAIDSATAPRSVRNNNPGNIEDGPFAQKMPGYAGSDGRFAIFDTPANGAGAMDSLLNNYGRQGLVTPMQIVSKWSPAGDGSNNPSAYAGSVARTLGIGVNDPIDMTNPAQRAALAQAMAKVEAGSGGGMPSSALGYTSSGLGGVSMPPSASSATGLGAAAMPTGGQGLGAADTSKARGLAGFLGFGPGGDGGLFGLSDDARQQLISIGAGIMSSQSKSPGIAIGQGVQQGIQTNQAQQKLATERSLAQAQAANMASENAYRRGTLSLDTRKEDFSENQAKRLYDALSGIGPGMAGSTSSPPGGSPAPVLPPPSATSAPAAGASSQPTGRSPAFDWSKVKPESNPAVLDQRADAYEMAATRAAPINPEVGSMYSRMATQARANAAAIRQSGKVTLNDGSVALLPGYTDTESAVAGAQASGKAAGEAPYRIRESQPQPGGPKVYTTDAAVLGQGKTSSNPGAGSPPGSTAGAPPSNVAEQPAFYGKKQDMIAENESKMVQDFQGRQIARQRLQDLQGILQNYQTGAFSEEKADLAAKLSAAGIPVSKGALDNAQNFQRFTKDAIANLFDNVKTMGGRVLVSEIDGLSKANANADLQPGANAAIIGQGIGLLDYEDKHTRDYFDWKRQNPNAVDTSTFELPWAQSNPVKPFVDSARLGTAAKGVAIPAASERVAGQAYMTPKGRAVWSGRGWRLAPQ